MSASSSTPARAGLLAAILIGLSLPGLATAAAEGIVVYNAQHEALGQAWADAFTKATGIPVTLRNGDDMEMANQLVLEGGDSPADVYLTENSPGMVLVDSAGLFAPLGRDVLDQVPERFRAVDGHWTGIAARSTVFAYDKAKLSEDELPASMLDLGEPGWSGRWGVSPAGADFQAIVGALLQMDGPERTASWLDGLREGAVTYRGNSAALRAVNAGQVDGALIYHYYWFGDQAKGGENSANVGLHYFGNGDPGAFVSVSGGGVLASSDHGQDAERFLAFVTGPEGQAILRDGGSFEYAVGDGDASNPALVPLAKLDAPAINPSTLDGGAVTGMMIDAGIL